MSQEEETARAQEAIRAARARVTNRRRIASKLAGNPYMLEILEEQWAPLWRTEPWEVIDDADLW